MYLIKTPIDLLNVPKFTDKILLGTWCISDQANVLQSRHSMNILPYHWDKRQKYNDDYYYLETVYEKLLTHYTKSLNEVHNTNYEKRYWRIILGPWLRFFIDSVFDRYEQLRSLDTQNLDLDCNLYLYNAKDWIPYDFSDFYEKLTSDGWNEVLFSECIKNQNFKYNQSEKIVLSPASGIKKKPGIIRKLVRKYDAIISNMRIKITILSSGFSLKEVLIIYFKLAKLPYFLGPKIPRTLISSKMSGRIKLPTNNASSNFEVFLGEMINKYIPLIYLENYAIFKNQTLKTFPKKTSIIYTANAYQGNDSFKFWCAERVSNGAKLIIGQHGGNFGLGLINQTEDHQLKIADSFLSWGWKRVGFNNIIPQASIKLSNKGLKQSDSGEILHILACFPRYFHCHYSMPAAGQFLNYLSNQIHFIKYLNEDNYDKIRLRLDASGNKFGVNVSGILTNSGVGEKIDLSSKTLMKRLQGCKICVCSHNATVFLETLACNFPTIVFWDPKNFEIRRAAIKKVEVLRSAGILHFSPEGASEMLNKISSNVSEWWSSDEVQAARLEFINSYAKASCDARKTFVNFIKST